MARDSDGTVAVLMALAIVIAGAIGWILNIVALFGLDWSQPVSGYMILRCAGVVFPPLGAVLGYI